MNLDIPTPRAFLPLLKPARFKGASGGRGSAKSHFFAEKLIEDCVATHIRAACVREVQNSIDDSVKQLLEDKIEKFGVSGRFRVLDREIIGPNESLIIFRGLQKHTASSIKSLEGFNRCWVEEAQAIKQVSLDTLTPTFRSGSELWFSWNPLSAKDAIERLFVDTEDDPDFARVHLTFRDNPWFPDELRRDMERDKRRDPDKYAHVWLGKYLKNSEARVFKNWEIKAFDIPEGVRFHQGGDWGFSVDPTVLVRSFVVGRTLYICDEAYEVGCEIDYSPFLFGGVENYEINRKNAQALSTLTHEQKERWRGIRDAHKWPTIADSARPETISYMNRHGFPKIKPAKKGAGSVEEGIEFLKSFDIVVHPRCKHTIDELTFYSFKIDSKTEEILPVLEDKKNHVIDALRYSVESLRHNNYDESMAWA